MSQPPPIDPTSPPEPGGDRDLTARVARIRRQRLLLALEQWGPGYHRVTGNGLRYVAEIVHATPEERDWLAAHVAAHPDVWTGAEHSHDEWSRRRHQQGQDALAAADTTYRAGDWDTARDHTDTAYALGAIDEAQWQRMHQAITDTARAATREPDAPGGA